ncbi:MAG: Fur family transcriptional regulator [Roseovarius sp.]|nr:Fur family transcriptional regulator [Roseovarius sp.]MCY4207208.1 Fur family transcriptional regulator [Roseovarius sp.]MCY4290454.1 Fur family transcriptional regulator [Roseovarius sp.]MCY4316841.1 Fur family transcriptional regulator [Roseovarius sp.]
MPRERSRPTHAERVLEFLKSQKRPFSAYEILHALRGDGVTAATTVYRALAKLLEAGQVHRIESLNAWTACREPHHSGTTVFEICDGCGSVTEHTASHLARDIAALSMGSGFAPDRSVIEIHGRCSDCGSTRPIT